MNVLIKADKLFKSSLIFTECIFFLFSVPPKIDLSIQMKSLITVKAGTNVCLDAQVFGKPMPTVTWNKEGEVVKPAEGVKISSKRNLFLLELFSVNRKETGEYSIVAENASGSKSATIKLKVLGMFT